MHILVSVVIIVSVIAYFFYASYSIRACIYMRVFCCKKTEEKIIAITFDDGPDPIQTPKVLKVLREKHIPACFFCIGNKIKGNEELLRQIIKEGHRIGNHSFSHSGYFPLYTFKRMCHDLITCQQELEKVTGQPVQWFRPPFGVTNPTLAQAVRSWDTFPSAGTSAHWTLSNPLLKKLSNTSRNGSFRAPSFCYMTGCPIVTGCWYKFWTL